MRDRLRGVLDGLDDRGAEYADARSDRAQTTKIEVKDRTVEELTAGDQRGIGVRVLYDGAWGFASTSVTDSLEETADAAFRTARALSRSTAADHSMPARDPVEKRLEEPSMTPDMLRPEQKLAIVEDAERAMRFASDMVRSTKVTYSDSTGHQLFMNTEGTVIERSPVHAALYCYATAKDGDSTETHLERTASTQGMDDFMGEDSVGMAETAAEMAADIVQAPRPPTGKQDVVLGRSLGGLFAHEAVGHAAEADTVLAGDSILEGRRGERVASEEVTLRDDPTREGHHGSYAYDDEGTPAQGATVIADGRLQEFLHTRSTAERLDGEMNGHARAQSYGSRPIARMSNTFFETGSHSDAELMEETDGLLVNGFRGGQVSTAEGNFTFGTTHAYAIEDGEPGQLYRGPTLSGLTLPTLKRITGVGKDLEIADPGYCGKRGQTVYVDTGSPRMRIEEVTLG